MINRRDKIRDAIVLPVEMSAKLLPSHEVRKSGNPSGERGIDRSGWITKVGLIEGIECFPPQLQAKRLREAQGFRQRPIGSSETRPSEYVRACVTKLVQPGYDECRLVEPLVSIGIGDCSLADSIGTQRAAIGIQGGRVGYGRREGRSGHPPRDPGELPAGR